MKRPLMTIGFSLFVSLAVFSYFRTQALVSIAVTFGIISIGLTFLARKFKLYNVILIFFGGLAATLLLLCSDFLYLRPAEVFNGSQIQAEGYVKQVDDASYILKCKIDGDFYNVYVKDYSTEAIRLGDKYKISGTVINANSVESNYIRSKCRSYSCALYAEDIEVVCSNDIVFQYPFEETIFKFKNFLLDRQKEIFADFSSGFINALTLGDRRGLDEDTAVAFKRAGLSHVLAISGMHLSIISGVVFFLLKRFGIRKAALFSLLTTLFYMAITGFAPAITRAGIMSIIMYLGVVIRADYDGLTAISAACTIMCLINPYSAADISLQLSVVSTVGILVILPPVRKLIWKTLGESTPIKRLLMWFSDIFVISIAANLALIPFYVFVFGTVSTVALFSNLVSSIFTPVIIIASILATLISIIPVISEAACVPAFISDVMVHLFTKITKLFASFKYSSISTEYTFVIIWALASCVLFGYALYTRKGRIQFHAVILSIVVLFASIFCYNVNNSSKIAVKVFPTYTYGCMVINEKNHTTAIYRTTDDENLYILNNKLSNAGIFKIETLIVPEYEDCAEVINLVADYDVSTLIIDNQKIDTTLSRKLDELDVDVISIYPNREIDIGKRTTVKFSSQDGIKCILADVDGVVFCMPFGEADMLEQFDFYKETDVVLIGKSQPYGLSYMDLSYIVFTNYNTESMMYKNTALFSENFAFTDKPVTFMVEDSAFYITKEWGSIW